jgi:hypothetical protein
VTEEEIEVGYQKNFAVIFFYGVSNKLHKYINVSARFYVNNFLCISCLDMKLLDRLSAIFIKISW